MLSRAARDGRLRVFTQASSLARPAPHSPRSFLRVRSVKLERRRRRLPPLLQLLVREPREVVQVLLPPISRISASTSTSRLPGSAAPAPPPPPSRPTPSSLVSSRSFGGMGRVVHIPVGVDPDPGPGPTRFGTVRHLRGAASATRALRVGATLKRHRVVPGLGPLPAGKVREGPGASSSSSSPTSCASRARPRR